MFGRLKDSWELARIGASIEGVVREAGRGDGTKVMQWYADFLKYTAAYCRAKSLPRDSVFALAMQYTPAANGAAFRDIVERLIAPGQLLHDVHESLAD